MIFFMDSTYVSGRFSKTYSGLKPMPNPYINICIVAFSQRVFNAPSPGNFPLSFSQTRSMEVTFLN